MGGADAVGGIGEVPLTPGERRTPGEGEGGARYELRTKMEEMEVGGEDMDEGEVAKADEEDA